MLKYASGFELIWSKTGKMHLCGAFMDLSNDKKAVKFVIRVVNLTVGSCLLPHVAR